MYALAGSAFCATVMLLGATFYYRSRGLASPDWAHLLFWGMIGAGAFVRWMEIIGEVRY